MLTTRCPAAYALAGPPTRGPSVICRVLHEEDRRADAILEGMVGGVLVTERDHHRILRGFCCGRALPKVDAEEGARAHHTFCPVWEEAEAAAHARKEERRLFGLEEQPKILGEDPEVVADILGIDPEQVIREEERFRSEHPTVEQLKPEIKTGVPAMEEVASDDEWKEAE